MSRCAVAGIEEGVMRDHRSYRPGTYEQMTAGFRWEVPASYNIADDVLDKHEPGQPAMRYLSDDGRDERWTFGDLQKLTNRTANALRGLGVGRGDRVAVMAPASPEVAATFLATYKCEAILLSMSVLYGDEGITHRLNDSGAKVLVTSAEHRDRVGALVERAPTVEHIVVIGAAGSPQRAGTGRESFEELTKAASDRFPSPVTDPDTPAQLYYSSGTTGPAKGILHAHRYVFAHEEFQFCHDVEVGELFHSTGEWAWIAGIVPGLLGPWRFGVETLVHGRKGGFDPGKALRLLADNGVGNVFATPTAIRAMMGVEDADKLQFRTRLACSAGEPLNPEAIAWWERTVGCPVLDFYGLTESYPLCGNFPTVAVRPGSMGLPLPGWDVALLDEDEQPVPQGEPGEICLRARSNPHYPLGYWNRPVRGGELPARAPRRRRVGRGGQPGRAARQRGQGIRPPHPRPPARRRPDRRAAAARAHAPVRLRLPAPGGVRRRPAQDPDRQDPSRRAARAGAGAHRGRIGWEARSGDLRSSTGGR